MGFNFSQDSLTTTHIFYRFFSNIFVFIIHLETVIVYNRKSQDIFSHITKKKEWKKCLNIIYKKNYEHSMCNISVFNRLKQINLEHLFTSITRFRFSQKILFRVLWKKTERNEIKINVCELSLLPVLVSNIFRKFYYNKIHQMGVRLLCWLLVFVRRLSVVRMNVEFLDIIFKSNFRHSTVTTSIQNMCLPHILINVQF